MVIVDVSPTEQIAVGIERLHLEQDAGKSLHDQSATKSYVDLNRSGVALMEIVSKPDMRSAEEARAYVTKLRTILRYLGTCDGNMEKGSLRADVNVSVRRPGATLGTRCEIKNVNSIRFIGRRSRTRRAARSAIIEDGGKIDQETRLFDPAQGRDPLDALEGRGARLSLFPRSRICCRSNSTQAYVEELAAHPAGTAGREEGALHHATTACSPYDAGRAGRRSARPLIISRQRSRRRGATRSWSPTG